MDFRKAAIHLLAAGLASCGGDDDDDPPPPPPNAVPAIQAQTFAVVEDEMLVSAQVVASDPGDALTYSNLTNPPNGVLQFSATGAFQYQPNQNFAGSDSFNVRVTDSANQSATATMTLTVAARNDSPDAHHDLFQVTSPTGLAVLANDPDVDNDPSTLTVTIVIPSSVGTAVVNADNTVDIRQLPANFKGYTRFRYRVTDTAGASREAIASVFIGIPAFKIAFLAGPGTRNQGGIYVNDTFATRLMHETTLVGANIDNLRFASSGRAVTFRYRNPVTNLYEIRWVDISDPERPGNSRSIHAPLGATESFGAIAISPNGRYVVYQFLPGGDPNASQIFLFDAQSTDAGSRLSLAPAQQPMAFNLHITHAGTYAYYTGRTSTTSPFVSAIYRANLTTRVVTRASPESSSGHSMLWPASNDSLVVDLRTTTGVPSSMYVTTPAVPETEQLLHEPLTGEAASSPALMSPDGSRFMFNIVDSTTLLPLRGVLAQPMNPGASVPIGGPGFGQVNTFGAGSMRADSQAMLVSKLVGNTFSLYEVPFATPDTPVTVASAVAEGVFSDAIYSADGAHMLYLRRPPGETLRGVLNVTRRNTLGQITTLPTPSALIYSYADDPSGYVVGVDSNISGKALINVDAPDVVISIGGEFGLEQGDLLPQ